MHDGRARRRDDGKAWELRMFLGVPGAVDPVRQRLTDQTCSLAVRVAAANPRTPPPVFEGIIYVLITGCQ